MRCIVTHRGESVGEVELQGGGPVPGAVAGPLEPTAAYARIREVCRQPIDAMVAAAGGIRALDAQGDEELSDDAVAAMLAGMQAVAALQLGLADLAGRPVATGGPISIQDYSGTATEHLAQVRDGAIMVGAILANPEAASAAGDT